MNLTNWLLNSLGKRERWMLNDGKGIKIMLLDSKFSFAPGFLFKENSLFYRDFIEESGFEDANDHTLICASMLVGDQQGFYCGLVPSATLFICRVLGTDKKRQSRAMIKAVQTACKNNIDIIVIPFGSVKTNRELNKAIAIARKRGVVVIAAAGNRGKFTHFSPAREKNTLSVSATDNSFKPLPECCQSDKIDLFLPGKDIPAVNRYGITAATGSSQACIIAAGLICKAFSNGCGLTETLGKITTIDARNL